MPRILVVAAAESRQRFGTILRQAGYSVAEADSEESALRVVDSNPPELILIAIVIPDSNGLEVAAALRRNVNSEGAPIILLGSVPPIGMNDEPLVSLVNGYLDIDASPDDVLAMVRSKLRSSQ
jgi:CheY-like chemotaxis protein